MEEIISIPKEKLDNGKIPLPIFSTTSIPTRQYTSRFKLAGPGDQWSEPQQIVSKPKNAPEIVSPAFISPPLHPDATETSYFEHQNLTYDPRNNRPMTDPHFSTASLNKQIQELQGSPYYSQIRSLVPISYYKNGEYPSGYQNRSFPTAAETRLAMSLAKQQMKNCTCMENCTCARHVHSTHSRSISNNMNAHNHANIDNTLVSAGHIAPTPFAYGQTVRDALSATEQYKTLKKAQFSGQFGHVVTMDLPVTLQGIITGNTQEPVIHQSPGTAAAMMNAGVTPLGLNLAPASLGREDECWDNDAFRTYVSTKSPYYDSLLVRSTYRPPRFSACSGKYPTMPDLCPYTYPPGTIEGTLERALRNGRLDELDDIARRMGMDSFNDWLSRSTVEFQGSQHFLNVPNQQQSLSPPQNGSPPNILPSQSSVPPINNPVFYSTENTIPNSSNMRGSPGAQVTTPSAARRNSSIAPNFQSHGTLPPSAIGGQF